MILPRRRQLKWWSSLLLGFFCISLLWVANQNVVYPSSSQSSTNYQIRVSTNILSVNQYVLSRIDSNRLYHAQLTELTVYQNLTPYRMVWTNPSFESQIAFGKAFVPPLDSYTPHSPISIVNDTDFANQALAEAWPGDGSLNNPYRIEHYTIDQAYSADDCIRIFNTTVHFIIQHCYVGNTTGPHAGILLEQTVNGQLKNNTCTYSSGTGIWLKGCNGILIENNTCAHSGNGIVLTLSNYITIVDNNCPDNSRGILFDFSNHTMVSDNDFNSNSDGVILYTSTDNTFIDNSISWNNLEGIQLFDHSNRNTFFNNTLQGNFNVYDLYVEGSDFNNIINNTCISDETYSGIELGDYSNNNTIANNTVADHTYGIYLWGTSNDNVVDNNYVHDNYHGIVVHWSHYNNFTMNICNLNFGWGDGIQIQGSDFCLIDRNTCNDNQYGIHIQNGADNNTLCNNICVGNFHEGIRITQSNHNTVTGCITYANGYGINIIGGSEDITIINNTCLDVVGIRFSNSGNGNTILENTVDSFSEGIILENTDQNFVANNSIHDCGNDGIWVSNSNLNTFINNTLTHNYDSGISIENSDSNTLFNNTCDSNVDYNLFVDANSDSNTFSWNTFIDYITENVVDNGLSNTFDYNYYSDYTGTDTNGDGIGETPHSIPGMAGNHDFHPLVFSLFPRWLIPPQNQFSEYGHSFRYDLNNTFPAATIGWWINDTTHFSIDADGVVTNETHLAIGSYGITVRMTNYWGHTLNGVFTIIVRDTTSPTWDSPRNWFQVEFAVIFHVKVNASDLSGIHHWWVEDTDNFTISSEGILSNTQQLPVGTRWIEIRAYDPSDNYCSKIFSIEVRDTTPPTWVTLPTNQTLTQGETLDIQLEATDSSGIAEWLLDDDYSGLFSLDQTGRLTSTEYLYPGEYELTVTVVDPHYNTNQATFFVIVTKPTTPFDPFLVVAITAIAVVTVVTIVIIVVVLRSKRKPIEV